MFTNFFLGAFSFTKNCFQMFNVKIVSVSGIIYIKFVNEDWMINPFSNNVSLLYPLKTSENLRLSDVLRGYRSGTLL